MLSSIILGWKGAAITGAAGLVIGLSGGWKAHSIKTKADKADALEAAHVAHIEAMAALQIELDSEASERLRLSAELDAAQGNVRTITREIIREVPKYVQDSTPDCDRLISVDAVRLLNSAASGSGPRSTSTETSPGNSIDALPVLAGDTGRYPTR